MDYITFRSIIIDIDTSKIIQVLSLELEKTCSAINLTREVKSAIRTGFKVARIYHVDPPITGQFTITALITKYSDFSPEAFADDYEEAVRDDEGPLIDFFAGIEDGCEEIHTAVYVYFDSQKVIVGPRRPPIKERDTSESSSLSELSVSPAQMRRRQREPGAPVSVYSGQTQHTRSPSPSGSAKPEQIRKAQDARAPISYNGRPQDITSPPITIFHEIFGDFVDGYEMNNNIPLQDLQYAAFLVESSLRNYDKEKYRDEQIQDPITNFLEDAEVFVQWQATTSSGILDAHVAVRCGLLGLGKGRYNMRSAWFELRNEIGNGGSDPVYQGAMNYARTVTSPLLSKLQERSCMPAFLVVIFGPRIAVYGLIYVGEVICQRLIDDVYMGFTTRTVRDRRTSPRQIVIQKVARLFISLRNCLKTLEREYRAMSPTDRPVHDILPAPHFTTFEAVLPGDGTRKTKCTLHYQKRLCPKRQRAAIFVADLRYNGGTKKVVVKFTSYYNKVAHSIMQTHGAAPTLLYCEWLENVGMYAVISSLVEEEDGTKVSESGQSLLRQALAALHGQNLVHGDIRKPNILVDRDGNPHVIDFDWAGEVGQAKYRMSINKDASWVEGVAGGQPIQKIHDTQMLDRFFATAL